MENKRLKTAVRIIIISVLALSIIIPGNYPAQRAYAYNNIAVEAQNEKIGAHQAINEIAYNNFLSQWAPSDNTLKNTSLDGKPVLGDSWEPADGTNWTLYKNPIQRQKSIKNWLMEGGFSADEPEWDMALRHFYDPVNTPHYLTDNVRQAGLLLQAITGIVTWTDLKTDAYQWCFEHPDNKFSFTHGLQNYRSAMADTNPNNTNYGKAWRAVGESMHLISDMTVPAHVRNDCHIPHIDWDPLEHLTFTKDIEAYSLKPAATGIDYKEKDVRVLFKNVATWTNKNFFSKDTLPVYEDVFTANGMEPYPSPTIKFDTENTTGYYTTDFNGDKHFPLAKAGYFGTSLWNWPTLKIDDYVCNAQRSVLIPTAIKASSAVLNAFLPRFKVTVESVKPAEKKDDYIVAAHITHIASQEWPDSQPISIGNGAHILVDSTDITVPLDSKVTNMNMFKYTVSARDDSTIVVYYDLGGYKISSDPYKISSVSSDSVTINSLTAKIVEVKDPPGGRSVRSMYTYNIEASGTANGQVGDFLDLQLSNLYGTVLDKQIQVPSWTAINNNQFKRVTGNPESTGWTATFKLTILDIDYKEVSLCKLAATVWQQSGVPQAGAQKSLTLPYP